MVPRSVMNAEFGEGVPRAVLACRRMARFKASGVSMVTPAVMFLAVACTPAEPRAQAVAAAPPPSPAPASASATSAATPTATASGATPSATANTTASDTSTKVPDIEYVPTPNNVVEKMLEVTKIQKTDVL